MSWPFSIGVRFSKAEPFFEIHFSNGKKALLSNEDIDLLCFYSLAISTQGYLVGYRRGQRGNPIVALHVIVAERVYGPRPSGLDVDHANRNRADCRRTNVRFLTRSLNNLNSDRAWGSRTYRYVKLCAITGKWLVDAKRHGINKRGFKSEYAAARWLKKTHPAVFHRNKGGDEKNG